MAKMQQIRLRLGLRPRPRWGSLQRSPDPLARFKGATSKGRGGDRRGGEGRGEERRRQGKEGRGGKERSACLPPRFDNPGYAPAFVNASCEKP